MNGISIDTGSLITLILSSFLIATYTAVLSNTLLDVPKEKHKYMFLFCYFMYMVITVPGIIFRDNFQSNLALMIIMAIYNLSKSITVITFLANISKQSLIKASIASIIVDTINTVLIILPFVTLPRVISGDYSTTTSMPPFRPYFIIIEIVIIIVYTLLYQLTRNYLFLFSRKTLKHTIFWWIVVILYIAPSFFQYKSSEYEEARNLILIVTITSLIFIFAIIQIAWAIRIRFEKHLLLENRELRKERAIMREYYATLSLQLDQTKQFQANIENHQKLLTTVSTNEQELSLFTEYTNDLINKYQAIQPITYCDNILINAILYNKQVLCDEKSISMNAKVISFPTTQLTDASFATLLSISLDTIINSCISDIVQKISVIIGNSADDLSIKIQMTYRDNSRADLSIENDLTSDTAIIEELLAPVNGSMQLEFNPDSCSLIIIIPGHITKANKR